MIPYNDEEQNWVSTGQHRKSNLNRERKVRQERQWHLPKHGHSIKTTIEVDGRTYVVPVQL